jgi:hypothetical protein
MVGLLGAVFLSLAFGYGMPPQSRHVVWVRMGILRGALEVLGLVSLGAVG